MFLENELMYGTTFDVSDEVLDKDFVAPIGKVKNIMTQGGHENNVLLFTVKFAELNNHNFVGSNTTTRKRHHLGVSFNWRPFLCSSSRGTRQRWYIM